MSHLIYLEGEYLKVLRYFKKCLFSILDTKSNKDFKLDKKVYKIIKELIKEKRCDIIVFLAFKKVIKETY